MAATKPLLSERILDVTGDVQSLAVTIREKDGSAPTTAFYDSTGNVVLNPVTSDALGLLEVFSNRPRRVQIRPAGSTAWVNAAFEPDPESLPLYLDDFAGALPINTGVNSAVDAMRAAIVAAQATGREIRVGAGTYIIDQVISVPSYVRIKGEGETTVFKHGDHSTQAIFQMLFLSVVGVHLSRFKIDGNYENNHRDSDGFGGAELSSHGTNCTLEDILITNFNCWGFLIGGERPRVIRCRAVGVSPVSYSPEYTGVYNPLNGLNDPALTIHLDLASIHGFITTSQSSCHGLYMEDCSATGTRATGIYVAGTNAIIVRPYVADCHRGYHPDVNNHEIPPSSGGPQIGFPSTSTAGTTANDLPPSRMIVIAPQIGPTSGPAAHGMEIGAAYGLTILDPYIESTSATGIAIAKGPSLPTQYVKIIGGTIKSCAGYGISLNDAIDVQVNGTDIIGCNTGVNITGTAANYLSFINMGFALNPTNWAMTATPTVLQSYGHRVEDGTAPPQIFSGVPTTTGTGSLGALAIAKAPIVAKCSLGLGLGTANDASANIAGCSASLTPGIWQVTGQFDFVESGAGDLNQQMQGLLSTSGGTASVTATGIPRWTPQTANEANTVTGVWIVSVTATTTAQLRAVKSGGGGGTGAGLQSVLTAIYLGNP